MCTISIFAKLADIMQFENEINEIHRYLYHFPFKYTMIYHDVHEKTPLF